MLNVLIRMLLLLVFTMGVTDSRLSAQAAVSASPDGQLFENTDLKISILPGWRASSHPLMNSTGVDLAKGNYILRIIPSFEHASGVIGGRFDEVIGSVPSVEAVVGNMEGPRSGLACGQSERTSFTETLSLTSFYTDNTKQAGTSGNECHFPSDSKPAWFGSYFSGPAPDQRHEYAITLGYDSSDVDRLPKKGSAELNGVFADVKAMLKTLVLKPTQQ